MDRILLHGIQCRVRLGVTQEERARPQDCLVDVELGSDLTAPMASDQIGDTLDYSRVYDLVQDLARHEEFALVERFVGRIQEELQDRFEYESLLVRAKKLNPPLAGSVEFAGIEIRR